MKTLSPTFISPAFSTLMFTPKNGEDPKTFFSSGSYWFNSIEGRHKKQKNTFTKILRYLFQLFALSHLSNFWDLSTSILAKGLQRFPAPVFVPKCWVHLKIFLLPFPFHGSFLKKPGWNHSGRKAGNGGRRLHQSSPVKVILMYCNVIMIWFVWGILTQGHLSSANAGNGPSMKIFGRNLAYFGQSK